MRAQNSNSKVSSTKVINGVFTLCVSILLLSSCQKDVAEIKATPTGKQVEAVQATSNVPVQLKASASTKVLYQDNANQNAVTFNWAVSGLSSDRNTQYTLEADNKGNGFSNPINMGTTIDFSIGVTVEQLNNYMRKLIATEKMSRVEFRLKISKTGSETITYSDPIAVDIEPYQPYVTYDDAKVFRVPGNFQNWTLPNAPKVVTVNNDGQYEGYVNFTNPNSQFLLVKGEAKWTELNTYQYIGGGKFGFGGSMFSLFEGAGIYRVQLNTNTNSWVCKRIKNWGLTGTAVPGTEAGMAYDDASVTWSITMDMQQGDFTMRANNSNTIKFGHNASSDTGVPDYNGTGIHINSAGNYTITLKLLTAGNYSYSVQKNG
ncbi:MAG: SusE domain-containing protein [Sediminibacterium sp.]